MYMENVKEHYWRYSLITIILGLGVILFFKITPFLGGILGAFTIYILLRGQMFHLTEKLMVIADTAGRLHNPYVS